MTPYLQDADVTLYHGDALAVLRELPSESVDCCVTSPPYWGLRDYGTGAWEGGDEGCDHKPERGKYAQGCVGCGCPMSQFSGGCAHCADRKIKRELRGTPEKDYAPYDPRRSDLPNPPAGWAERDSTVTALQTCPRCGATRIDQQLGLEPTPEEYVTRMVEVFREVRRVLASHGTVWLNLGDSYYAAGWESRRRNEVGAGSFEPEDRRSHTGIVDGLKVKDLVGIPWVVAKALQAPYYTGKIKDERDRIWLAAVIEAEGCLFIHKRGVGQYASSFTKKDGTESHYHRKNATYGSGLEVASTDRVIVERCMEITGIGSICEQSPDQNKRRKQTIYRWNVRSNECRWIIEELYPHFYAKQHEARLLIGCPSSGPDAEKAHSSLKALHNGQTPDIDFAPPKLMWEPGWFLRSDIIWAKPQSDARVGDGPPDQGARVRVPALEAAKVLLRRRSNP